jgi:membrane protease YdiL (CAAX protease family)
MGDTLTLAAILAAETALLLLAGVRLLRYQLRQGVAAAGVQDSARRTVKSRSTVFRGFGLKSAVQRRELMLLGRDRNFLVQSLVLPVIILSGQVLLSGRVDSLSVFWDSPAMIASVAFSIAAYVLMLSAFQTLNAEGGALWLLYTFPRSIESILKEKARMWAVLALIYPLIMLALEIVLARTMDWSSLRMGATALLGVPIYSVIAVSLGVFACNPFAQDVHAKLRPTYVYLYMLLTALYVYAIVADEWWRSLAFIVLAILLALALWRKSRDELPYLLDPTALLAPQVSTADGLIAAMLFFVLQGVALLIIHAFDNQITGSGILLAFTIAAAITYFLARFTYWRAKTSGVPVVFNRAPGQALGYGLGAGAVAGLLGVAYILAAQRLGLWEQPRWEPTPGFSRGLWIFLLAVLVAPLFEEFIFRGLIFGGLRRSMAAGPSIVASAAIFAIVHPPVFMLPVFVLGACAAFAYQRSNILLAPMLTHAVYNAVVVGYQMGSG